MGAASLSGCVADRSNEHATVEMFSWWVESSEAAALRAILDLYRDEYPGVEVINAAAREATTARQTLSTRFAQGNPPDTFQANGGYDLIRWVAERGTTATQSKLEDLTWFFEEEGLFDVIPEPVLEAVSHEGAPYAVPLNIHRNNSLFFHRGILEAVELPPPTTFEELLATCETLRAGPGIPCLAAGAADSWALELLLWENVMVATAGAEYYEEFFTGRRNPREAQVEQTVDNLLALWEYAHPAALNTTWVDAVLQVGNGEAAFNVMGDWAKAALQQRGSVPDVDFGQIAFPGTAGTFVFVTDTFPLSRGGPARAATIDLLRVMASPEGQETFNLVKGSIPARLDVPTTRFDPLGQRTYAEFGSAQAWLLGNVAPTDFELGPHITMTLQTGKREILLNGISNFYDVVRKAHL